MGDGSQTPSSISASNHCQPKPTCQHAVLVQVLVDGSREQMRGQRAKPCGGNSCAQPSGWHREPNNGCSLLGAEHAQRCNHCVVQACRKRRFAQPNGDGREAGAEACKPAQQGRRGGLSDGSRLPSFVRLPRASKQKPYSAWQFMHAACLRASAARQPGRHTGHCTATQQWTQALLPA